jgi:hypothetical protein
MKTVSLKETRTSYLVKVDRESLTQGPTLVQQDGQAIAVLVPIDEYLAFQEWQAARQRSTSPDPEFEAQVAAFERLKPELLKQYRGRAVAIYQGQVVEVGDDKLQVLGRIFKRYGDVRCYIEWVEPDAPRRVRVPSVRRAA